MKRTLLSLSLLTLSGCMALAQTSIDVRVENKSKTSRSDVPVVVELAKFGKVKSAVVMADGKEIPCQLDDLNGDGQYDELCFLTDMDKKSSATFKVQLYEKGKPRTYPSKVYARMMLPNKKVKDKNKHDIYISSLTVDGKSNAFSSVHAHGPLIENELLAMRIYFDVRQTPDLYGKYHKGLELKDTQFYPSKEQKAAGYGDDILWAGNTFGLGALRGWNGQEPQMLDDLASRTMTVVSGGPVRAVVKIIDKEWNPKNATQKDPVDLTTYYILYAGHRDCTVRLQLDRNVPDYDFSTGIINIKDSKEYSDHKGTRGCWGTDWPVALKDTAGWKRETVGLGIAIPSRYVKKELPATADNYPFVVGTSSDRFEYYITYSSDNEDFGYHSAKDWFKFLKEWREEIDHPVTVTY